MTNEKFMPQYVRDLSTHAVQVNKMHPHFHKSQVSILVWILGFTYRVSCHMQIVSFPSSFPIQILFFSCLIAVTKTSNSMLNRKKSCFILEFTGKAFSFLPVSIMLALALQYNCSAVYESSVQQLYGRLMATSSTRDYAHTVRPRSAAPRVPAPVAGQLLPIPLFDTLKNSKAGLAQSLSLWGPGSSCTKGFI